MQRAEACWATQVVPSFLRTRAWPAGGAPRDTVCKLCVHEAVQLSIRATRLGQDTVGLLGCAPAGAMVCVGVSACACLGACVCVHACVLVHLAAVIPELACYHHDMYRCMCQCIRMYLRVSLCVCLYVCMCSCVVYVFTYMFLCLCLCISVYMCVAVFSLLYT